MPRPQLAKLTRPRLHKAVVRERLFILLDRLREHPAVWVDGPPGSGKTTLLASYVETTKAPAVWSLLDSGDSDPASFFYYLGQAIAGSARRNSRPMPLLTPEYLADLEGFSHRFFRNAFARLPEGSLVVLDNYHEVRPESELHGMLAAGISEVPQGSSVVVISRTEPPATFTRSRISGHLAVLGWEQLRLEPAETSAIVAARKASGLVHAEAIHARADGWVAGVRLLLEGDSRHSGARMTAHPLELEATFNYFAVEIFDGAPVASQNVMIRAAFLPRFTADMAASISREPRAEQFLEQMYRRRLFVDRRLGESVYYQFHDLFRDFLQDQARRRLTPGELVLLVRDSAGLLLTAGLANDAFALFAQAKDWAEAERLFLNQASTLIAHGRSQTLAEWGSFLPAGCLDANPWLRYWLGTSRALVDAAEAFPILEAAYWGFCRINDVFGQLLCAATVVETLHFVVQHWDTMGAWLARLKQSLAMLDVPLSADDELRVHAALFWAADNTRDPANAAASASVARALELLPFCTDVNLRISAANMLHYHSERNLDDRTTRFAAREAHAVLDSPDLSADRRALYFLAEGFAHMDFARYREALDCYDRADAIIEANGLVGRDHIAGVWRALCQYAAGDLSAARATLARTEKLKAVDLHVITQVLETTRAWIAFGSGDFAHALAHNQAAIDICERLGPYCGLSICLPIRAYIAIVAGQPGGQPLARIRKRPDLMEYERIGGAVALLESWEALRSGHEATCRKALREALELARDERDRLRIRWYPKALEDLLPIALEEEIETDSALALIRETGIAPPPGAPEAWPWPVRICVLGRFEVMLAGKPLEFGRKAPKRTLALLKAIVAFGGIDVPEQRLADALWPDLDGDAAFESMASALHRLRRLLGGNDTIRQNGGMLSLNEQRCYVDARAFESCVQHGKEQAAIDLYRGKFLQAEGDAPWMASIRERLNGKFIRAVDSAGRGLEDAAAYEDAIRLYVRGIEADELVEPFYRGLMRCYDKLGRQTEAAGAYRRLRQTLSVTLGTQPSPESRELFERLRNGQPSGS